MPISAVWMVGARFGEGKLASTTAANGWPFGEDDLAEMVHRIRARSSVLADVTLIACWFRLRWGE
jgi:hypothetical protein